MAKYPIIHMALDTSQVVVWDFFHQQYLRMYLLKVAFLGLKTNSSPPIFLQAPKNPKGNLRSKKLPKSFTTFRSKENHTQAVKLTNSKVKPLKING